MPVLWLVGVYGGSLAALLTQSFFSLDSFAGTIDRTPTLDTWRELFTPANRAVIGRTVGMATAVTIGGGDRRPAPRLLHRPLRIDAGQGVDGAGGAAPPVVVLPGPGVCLEADPGGRRNHQLVSDPDSVSAACSKAILDLPVIGGPSLSVSYLGQFVVFLYIWLPFMVLPIVTALERVPRSYLEASADLGAKPGDDISQDRLAAGDTRDRGRLDLHLLADAGRLHHPHRHRGLQPVHRAGDLQPAGGGRQPACRRRVLIRSDRGDGGVPDHRPAARRLRDHLMKRAKPVKRARP